MTPRRRIALTYILPLRARTPHGDELARYIAWLSERVHVVIVDSSERDVFSAHHAAWARCAEHVPLDPALARPVGKVGNVLTGLRHARTERVIIADDDVRYDDRALREVARALDTYDVVRPQNYFDPLPWHAIWDTGRTLLNRTLGGDWPGTLGVRRSVLESTGGYSGTVMFENLELVRTVQAAGGRERVMYATYVRRAPCDTSHFLSQRVRQAFDELARPGRLVTQLAILPIAVHAARRRRWSTLGAATIALVAIAEAGRRRDGGIRFFPFVASLAAPLWVAERAITSWLAVGMRITRGGVIYHGRVIDAPATPMWVLERRFRDVRHARERADAERQFSTGPSWSSTSIGLNEPLFESSAEHAVTPTY